MAAIALRQTIPPGWHVLDLTNSAPIDATALIDWTRVRIDEWTAAGVGHVEVWVRDAELGEVT